MIWILLFALVLNSELNSMKSTPQEYSIVELIEHDVAKCCCNKVKTTTKAFEDVNGKSSYV
jgi:hypothetical protein